MAFLPIFDAISPVIDKLLSYIPDPKQKLEAQQLLLTQIAQSDTQQSLINQAEAANGNLFVSGWRPFMGWVCGVAFAYKFVLQPFLIFAIMSSGSHFDPETLPVLDWAEMSSVLLGLLGLGTMRTVEKIQGVK